EKSGDRLVLLKALLDIAQVPSSWAFLRYPESILPETDWTHPSTGMFATRVIALEPDSDTPTFIDFTVRDWPLGRLPDYFSGGAAMILADDGARIVRLPVYPAAEHGTNVDATYRLAPDLSAEIDLRMVVGSIEGWAQKERLRTARDFQKDLMGRGLASNMFPGCRVSELAFLGLDKPEEPFGLTFKLTVPQLLRASGDEALLPVVHQASYLVRSYGGAAKREHPFHLRRTRAMRARIRVELGDWEIVRIPRDTVLASPLGLYTLRFVRAGDAIEIEQALTLEPGRLGPEEFASFLRFATEIDERERERIVIRR